ncbi:MAG: hypothetical protein JNK00_11095, partial [Flavipsychrobacter sp.]|nr:hypothetical protein [Flavipsychrobacter sp.]
MSNFFSLLRKVSITIVVLLSLVYSKTAQACHYGAADIYVTYIGAGQDGCTGTTDYSYEVTLTIYLACQDCTLDYGGTDNVSVSSVNYGGLFQSLTVTDINGSTAPPDTVHSLCPNAADSNSCRNLANKLKYPAFRRRIFRNTITLPNAQTDWVFRWSNGGRNLSNVTGCGNLYVEAFLNNVTKYNNSTPRFTTIPLPYLCVNQPGIFLNGPVDVNGDSIQVYQQFPYTAQNSPCGYAAPYSVTDPVGSAASNPYVLNPTTGAATFTPTNTGFYVLAFRAEDFERGTGVKLSHVFRDVQISVLPCSDPPPAIDSLTPKITVDDGAIVSVIGGGKAIVTCPNNKLKFSLTSATSAPGHFIYMYANTGIIPGSTFNVVGAGSGSVTGTFDWTPGPADIGEHSLIVTSADSSCTVNQPIVLKNYTVIYIKVIGGLDAGPDLSTCNINPPGRQLFVKGFGNLDIDVKWTDISGGPAKFLNNDTLINPISMANERTQYVVSSPDLKAQCKSRDTMLVYIDTSNTIDIFPHTDNFVLCRPDYLQLDVNVKGSGPISNINCGVQIPNAEPQDSVMIYGTPAYGSGFAFDTAGTTTPVLGNQNQSAKYQYLIRKEELLEYGLRAATLKSLSFETVRNQVPTFEYGEFSIYVKCTDKTELKKNAGFETGLTLVYKAPGSTQFPDGWHKFDFDTYYSWDTTKNLIVQICFSNNPTPIVPCGPSSGLPPIIKFMPTTYIGGLVLLPANAPPTVPDVCNVTTDPNIKEYVTRPVFRFNYTQAPGLPFEYKWFPGQYLSDSTVKQPLSYVSKSARYSVQTFGKNGCILRDTLDIYVPVHDFSVWPKDTSICFGEVAPLEVRKGTYHEWFEFENGKFKSAHESLS